MQTQATVVPSEAVETAECCGCGRTFEVKSFEFATPGFPGFPESSEFICDDCMVVSRHPNPQQPVQK